MERLGLKEKADFIVPELSDANTALLPEGTSKALFLEDFRFSAQSDINLSTTITALARLMGREDATTVLTRQLVIVHDDRFNHLAQYATPVNPHICIDNQTKTVKTGALWYEESLPPDTMLYITLYAQATRVKGETKTAADILRHSTVDLFQRPYLQLGGNETVGMGWCKVTICQAEG
jgi:CRISPR-associated protein Cmr4